MKQLTYLTLLLSLISFSIAVHADFFNKVKNNTKKVFNESVEIATPAAKKTTHEIEQAANEVAGWFSATGNTLANNADDLVQYSKILEAAGETGHSHSGSLEYTGPASPAADAGSFTIMTYNIDGSPQALGGNSPEDTRKISAILERMAYDMVNFQEDFTKHAELLSNLSTTNYPYRSDHWKGTATSFGDGLTTIAKFPFNYRNYKRIQWRKCGGTLWQQILGTSSHPDCLTEKGFSVVTVDIDAGLQIDLYNLHQDAGGDSASLMAKQTNMAQLAHYINTYSSGKVVIVAGDFNMELGALTSAIELTHLSIWLEFLNNTGLSVLCMEVYQKWDDCDAAGFDKPDHILFKGNHEYALFAQAITHAAEFGESNEIDPDNGLSDHYPLKGTISWQKNN